MAPLQWLLLQVLAVGAALAARSGGSADPPAAAAVTETPSSPPIPELFETAYSRFTAEAQSGHHSPADLPLSRLLSPLVERLVTRVLSRRNELQRCSLEQMQTTLDAVARDVSYVAGVVTAHSSGGCNPSAWQLPPPLAALAGKGDQASDIKPTGAVSKQDPGGQPSAASDLQLRGADEKERSVSCERQPRPSASGAAPFEEPVRRACARSCLQLRNQAPEQLQDGVYWLTGLPVPVFCDFSHDGGGWTLLLTTVSNDGWDVLAALGRNERAPSLTDNYSILRHADSIRDLGEGARFAYRIEGSAQTGRQRWGGVWFAPRSYTFVDETARQTDVALVRQFDTWIYNTDTTLHKRMPWLNSHVRTGPSVMTTATTSGNWWGTLVTRPSYQDRSTSPWIEPARRNSGTVLYWMREEIK